MPGINHNPTLHIQTTTQPGVEFHSPKEPKTESRSGPSIEISTDAQSRVAQQDNAPELNVRTKDLKQRDVTTQPFEISREGMRKILGKATIYSNLKDKMMRLAFKINYRTTSSAGAEFGSHRKVVDRLADKYQQLKKSEPHNLEGQRNLLLQIKENLHQISGRQLMETTFKNNLDTFDHVVTLGKTAMDLIDAELEPLQAQLTPPSKLSDPDISQFDAHFMNDMRFQISGSALATALKSNDQAWVSSLVEDVGMMLAEDLSKAPREVQLGSVSSNGTALLDQMAQALNEQMSKKNPELLGTPPLFGDSLATCSAEGKKFLTEVFNHATRNLPDRQLDDNHLMLRGHQFTKVKTLGEGAFGKVDLYERQWKENGKTRTEQIAVKTPKETHPKTATKAIRKQLKASSDEVRGHYSVDNNRDDTNLPNVLRFKGAIRGMDDRIMIISEYAPKGDVQNALERLHKAEKDGTLSPHTAMLVRATLLHDMIGGMNHLHSKGITHLDVKPANYFISADGTAKIADFGFAESEMVRKFDGVPLDNTAYSAPEIFHAREARNKARAEEIEKIVRKEAPPLRHGDDDNDMRERLAEHQVTLTDKSDVWAVGISAFQLFFNRAPFGMDEDMISKFDGDITEYTRPPDSNETAPEGLEELEHMLMQMLNPDPEKRPSLATMADHALFQQIGVGSEMVRDLIQTLTDPDASDSDISKASKKMDKALSSLN